MRMKVRLGGSDMWIILGLDEGSGVPCHAHDGEMYIDKLKAIKVIEKHVRETGEELILCFCELKYSQPPKDQLVVTVL
jgi:hypothetical protein